MLSTDNKKQKVPRTTPKLQVMLYLGTLPSTIAWETASQTGLRNYSKEFMEEPAYIGVFAENKQKMWSNMRRSLLITEKQTSHFNDFSAFLCVGRSKSPGSLKLFLRCASEPSRASVLCFSILISPYHGLLMAAIVVMNWWQAAFIVYQNDRQHAFLLKCQTTFFSI